MLHHTKILLLMNSDATLWETRTYFFLPLDVDERLDVRSRGTQVLINHSKQDLMEQKVHNIKLLVRIMVTVSLEHEVNLEGMNLVKVACLGSNGVLVDLAHDIIDRLR